MIPVSFFDKARVIQENFIKTSQVDKSQWEELFTEALDYLPIGVPTKVFSLEK